MAELENAILKSAPRVHESEAVEGYVYSTLLARKPTDSVKGVDGWAQTSTAPSPLSKLVFEQQRRLMRNCCFNWGAGGHSAYQCDKPSAGVRYTCVHCTKQILNSSRGQSVGCSAATVEQAPLPAKILAASPVQRSAHSAPQEHPAKVPRSTYSKYGKFISLCNQIVASISWYVGQEDPAPFLCQAVKS